MSIESPEVSALLNDGRTPHITISTADGVEAVYSNELLRTEEALRPVALRLTGEVAVALQPSAAAAAKARRRIVADAEEATRCCRRTRRSCGDSRSRGSTTGSLPTTTARWKSSTGLRRRRTRARPELRARGRPGPAARRRLRRGHARQGRPRAPGPGGAAAESS